MFEEFIFENTDDELERIEYRLIEKLDLKGDLLIDMGGGYGRISSILAERFNQIYILEYSKKNIEKFRVTNHKSNIHAIRGDFVYPPFMENVADYIISIRAIHHYEKPGFLKDWIKCLKPGGHLMFNINNLRNITNFYDMVIKNTVNPLSGKGVTCVSSQGLKICFHSRKYIEDILRDEIKSGQISFKDYGYGFLHRNNINKIKGKFPLLKSADNRTLKGGFYSKFFTNFILIDIAKNLPNI